MTAQANFQRLPLLDLVDKEFSALELNDCYLLACQNLLGSTHTLLQYLFSKGLQPSKVSVIGKCYSTSDRVVEQLRLDGVYVSPFASHFNPYESFDVQFRSYVHEFVEERKTTIPLGSKVLILDEGAELLDGCNRLLKGYEFSGVEQSTKTEVLQRLKLTFPCTSIARCKAKLFAETPFISETIIQKLSQYLTKNSLPAKQVLVIGGGPLGRQISTDLLKMGLSVYSYDNNVARSNISHSELARKIQDADIIVGCTYGEALSASQLPLLKKGVILANAALSDRTFPSVTLRRLTDKIESCHDHLLIDHGKVHLMNCGFPVNFDGGTHSVPPAKIQITRALLFAAICESATFPSTKKISEPTEEIQNIIIQAFCSFFPEQFRQFEEFKDL